MAQSCPRCHDAPLQPAQGALHEDVCARCHGRFLDGDTVAQLCERHLRITADILRELAQSGPRRLLCPGCGHKMTLTMLRGVQADLCAGCGGAWLDAGELASITQGGVAEVSPTATSSPSTASSSVLHEAQALFGDASSGVDVVVGAPLPARAAPIRRERFGVVCTNCDVELDLRQDNWMINSYPWCPTCAAPHTSLWSHVVGIFGAVVGGLFAFFAPFVHLRSRRYESHYDRAQRRREEWGEAIDSLSAPAGGGLSTDLSTRVDAYRVVPAEAEMRFASFFRVMRS